MKATGIVRKVVEPGRQGICWWISLQSWRKRKIVVVMLMFLFVFSPITSVLAQAGTSSVSSQTKYQVVNKTVQTDNGYSNSSVSTIFDKNTTYMDINALQVLIQKFGIPNYINENNWYINKKQNAGETIEPLNPSMPVSVCVSGKQKATVNLVTYNGKVYFPIRYLINILRQMRFYAHWDGEEFYLAKYLPAHSVVNPNQIYTYAIMVKDIKKLAAMYPDLINYEVVGKTVYGRNIYAVSLGKGPAAVFINGSHHAREWITTILNMYMIDQYALAYRKKASISGYRVRDILNKTTIWFIPMVNPDGVTLAQFGAGAFPKEVRPQLIKWNEGSTNFLRWKGNAQGIDPNRQYDGGWYSMPPIVKGPHFEGYRGTRPFEINEVKAVVYLVKKINAQAEISYHSSGGVIYWGYKISRANYNKFRAFALKMGKLTGYKVTVPNYSQTGGGMTDWWTHNIGRPGFTIEVGPYSGAKPVPVKYFPLIWKQNKTAGLELAVQGYELYRANPHKVIH
jgi:hypothetical protein